MFEEFPDVPKLNKNNFSFLEMHYKQEEPFDGLIEIKRKPLYFKYFGEFDNGNTYIVYSQNTPVYYFVIETGERDDIQNYYIEDVKN